MRHLLDGIARYSFTDNYGRSEPCMKEDAELGEYIKLSDVQARLDADHDSRVKALVEAAKKGLRDIEGYLLEARQDRISMTTLVNEVAKIVTETRAALEPFKEGS